MSYYDILLAKQLSGGGGGDITVESLSVTANGTYTAPSGKAYSPVSVNVPFVTYRTGTTDPASSLGSDGDIYLKVVS